MKLRFAVLWFGRLGHIGKRRKKANSLAWDAGKRGGTLMGKGFHDLFWICGIIFAVSLISAINDKGAFYTLLVYGLVLAFLFGVLLFVFSTGGRW